MTPCLLSYNTLSSGLWHPVFWVMTPFLLGYNTLSSGLWHPVFWTMTPCLPGYNTLSSGLWHPVFWVMTPCLLGYVRVSSRLNHVDFNAISNILEQPVLKIQVATCSPKVPTWTHEVTLQKITISVFTALKNHKSVTNNVTLHRISIARTGII